LKVYDQNWSEITDLSTLKLNQRVYFATKETGTTTATRARFKITVNGNASDWQETSSKNSQGELYISYTINQSGSYEIQAQVYLEGVGRR